MIMNKKQFCKAINAIRQIQELQNNVNEHFRYYRKWAKDDFAEFEFPTLETTLITALEIMFDDTESNYIAWWIYECNMGKEKEENLTITYSDLTTRVIKTEQDLYDFLVDEMKG